MIVACKIADHRLSVAQNIVILNYGTMNEDKLNPFDLNRTEYASLLGISPNAVRMRMRHGKLEGEYIFKNGKYFWFFNWFFFFIRNFFIGHAKKIFKCSHKIIAFILLK